MTQNLCRDTLIGVSRDRLACSNRMTAERPCLQERSEHCFHIGPVSNYHHLARVMVVGLTNVLPAMA